MNLPPFHIATLCNSNGRRRIKDEEILKRIVDITITEKRTNGKRSRYRIAKLESLLILKEIIELEMQVDFNEI